VQFLADVGLGVPAVVVVGMIFYVLIERPFMVDNWPSKTLAALRLQINRRRVADA